LTKEVYIESPDPNDASANNPQQPPSSSAPASTTNNGADRVVTMQVSGDTHISSKEKKRKKHANERADVDCSLFLSLFQISFLSSCMYDIH
jgi:hypothetical protein